MTFETDIKDFEKKFANRADRVIRASFLELSTRVIRRSPVGDADHWKPAANGKIYKPAGYAGGRFRANWQAKAGRKPTGSIDTDDSPETNSSVASDSVNSAASSKNKKRYYLMNNLPYAKAIESGHSRQAPAGIIKLAILEWKDIVKLVNKLVK